MVANIPPIDDANAAGPPVPPDPPTPDMVGPATETEVPDAVPDPVLSPLDAEPAPEPEEETSEQFMRRLVEENSWRMKPRPSRLIPPPEPKPIHLMTPEEMHESLPVHLRRRRPDGSYPVMGLISRMQTDLAELTQGKRAATYPEVDEYLGYALLAEGLAPRGMSATDAVKWWRAGGSEVLSERPNIATAPSAAERPFEAGAPAPAAGLPAFDKNRDALRTTPALQPAAFVTGLGDNGNPAGMIRSIAMGAAQEIPWGGFGEGWRLPLPDISPEQLIENAGGLAADELRRRLNDLKRAGTGAAAKTAAFAATTAAINTPFTTPLAARLLTEWRDGMSNTTMNAPEFFGWDSEGTHELLFGYSGDYYRNISSLGIAQLAARGGGKVKPDEHIRVDDIPPFGTRDGSAGLSDGINVGDTIGTFTYGVRAKVRGDFVYFTGRNAMSLGSFSGDNLLRHGQVDNPRRGRFSTTYQTFEWRVRIPPALLSRK